MQREKLGSRLGFILLSAGCAIGIGNVWKFPYIAGENGGAIFVLFYFAFLVLMGVPIMTMEFSLGRAAQKSPAVMYRELEPGGSKWHLHGYASVIGNYLLMMFYTTVCGWMLRYFVSTAGGALNGLSADGIEADLNGMMSNPLEMGVYMVIAVAIAVLVCSIGVQKGLERVTKYMMLALIVIMIGLGVRSFFLEGGEEGLKFYLLPSIDRMNEVGIGNVVVAAMNQAFFTLSLGIGSMAIFGSYIGRDRALMGEAVTVATLDTFVAVCSGLIIFPACYAYNIKVDSGPDLIFKTLPNVFNNMPFGQLFGALFFVFMSFAALSTVLAVFENIVACTCELFGWERKRSCVINGIAIVVLSMPCVLGFNLLSGIMPLGAGSNIMDMEDFAVSNVLLPLGALTYVLFCTSRYGWGFDKFMEAANTGKGLKVKKWMKPYFTYVLPVAILALFCVGIYTKFFA